MSFKGRYSAERGSELLTSITGLINWTLNENNIDSNCKYKLYMRKGIGANRRWRQCQSQSVNRIWREREGHRIHFGRMSEWLTLSARESKAGAKQSWLLYWKGPEYNKSCQKLNWKMLNKCDTYSQKEAAGWAIQTSEVMLSFLTYCYCSSDSDSESESDSDSESSSSSASLVGELKIALWKRIEIGGGRGRGRKANNWTLQFPMKWLLYPDLMSRHTCKLRRY